MSRERLPLRFVADGRDVNAVTVFADGADQLLVLATTSPDLLIELRSVYIGGDGTDEVLVSEAATGPEGPTIFATRRLGSSAGILVFERRRVLYDHLQRLQELAAEAHTSGLEVRDLDAAAAMIDPAHSVATTSEPL